jgi:hypothetical protein
MIRATAVCFVLVLALSSVSSADFQLVGKIPAPHPSADVDQWYGVSGMAVNTSSGDLFVTVPGDSTTYIYLIDPSTGAVQTSYAFDLDYGQTRSYFSSAAHEAANWYWVTDFFTGHFLALEWLGGDTCFIYNQWTNDALPYPTGLCMRDYNLWATDMLADSLYKMDTYGAIYERYTCDDAINPTSIAEYGDGFLVASQVDSGSVFEFDQAGNIVDGHAFVDYDKVVPQSMVYYGERLYVGIDHIYTGLLGGTGMGVATGDSILIFEPTVISYEDTVPAGSDITVDIVPENLEVTFEDVTQSGSLYVDVTGSGACPPPGDVEFFSDYFDVSTTASFDYVARVDLLTDYEIPDGVNKKKVRVFKRPSGACTFWRDITVAPLEEVPPPGDILRVISRTWSEDDEFSVFVLGEDNRTPSAVIALKFNYLKGAITSNDSLIPNDVYSLITSWVDEAEDLVAQRSYVRAAYLVDRVATKVRNTPAIPHTYYPSSPGSNVAGAIISRARTLSFSINQLIGVHDFGDATPGGKHSPGTPAAPLALRLTGPNPAEGFSIMLSGRGDQPATVKIYSVEGELVRTILSGEVINGARSVTWTGETDLGKQAAPGTYFAVAEQGDYQVMKKLILQR